MRTKLVVHLNGDDLDQVVGDYEINLEEANLCPPAVAVSEAKRLKPMGVYISNAALDAISEEDFDKLKRLVSPSHEPGEPVACSQCYMPVVVGLSTLCASCGTTQAYCPECKRDHIHLEDL